MKPLHTPESVEEVVEELERKIEYIVSSDGNEANGSVSDQVKNELRKAITTAEARGAERILHYIDTRFEDREMVGLVRKELSIKPPND